MADNPYLTPDMIEAETANPYTAPNMAEQSPDTLTDVSKSVRAGAIRAPLHVIGLPGDVQTGSEALAQYARRKIFGEQYAGELPTKHLPTTMDIARRLGGPAPYIGQTIPGRLAGGTVETALDPLSFAVGPGSLAARVGIGAVSGFTGAAGEEVAGPAGGLIGGAIPSLIGGSAIERAAAQTARPAAPTPTELRDAFGDHFHARDLARAQGNEQAATLAENLETAVLSSKTGPQLRTKLQQIAENKNLTADQKEGLRKIINSGNWLELLAAGRMSHLPVSAWAIHLLSSGNWKEATTIFTAIAAREGTRKLDRSRTASATKQMREDVLRGAPSGGGKLPPLPSHLSPEQIPAATVRGLLTPEQETPP